MKFRIWNNSLRSFVSPSEYFVNGDGDVFFFDMMDGGLIKCDKCIVQYWSGYLDIHEKEIYVGDIVKFIRWDNDYDRREREDEDVVKWNGQNFYPVPFKHHNDDDGWYSYGLEKFEVIGNVFENSNLLK